VAHVYYSDREYGPKSRIDEEITENVWGGIIYLIKKRITDSSFGNEFPLYCEYDRNNEIIAGCNLKNLSLALKSEVPGIEWPLDPEDMPDTLIILDLIEFCYQNIAKPELDETHEFLRHNHLNFNIEEGQKQFRNDINKILARNGIAYELKGNGRIERIASPALDKILMSHIFDTGDKELDNLLNNSIKKYLDPDSDVHEESLEKLWDAWERLKTIEPGKDKKISVTILLDKVTKEPNFRKIIEDDASELTDIGNIFRIRHSETDTIQIGSKKHVDYLFHRMFSLIWLILIKTNRLK
jgi:hypothetical protein